MQKEKLNTHKLSRQCLDDTFTYGDVFDLMKMNDGKDCVEKFVQDNEDKVKPFYAKFPQQPMTELTDVMKK